MGNFKIKYDQLLFALLMVLLFVPIIQEWIGIFPVKPMKGVFVPTPKPELTFEAYKTNTYQTQIDKYTSENFGLRETVIRLYNQYLWDFFHKTPVKEQIVYGKDGWLYEPGSVSDSYQRLFRFFAADSTQMASMLSKEAHQLLLLQQILESHGTHLFVCLVPAKDLIYPEHLPDNQSSDYKGEPKISARYFNEEVFTNLGVNHLNLEQWFLQIKDTADFALFPKTGMHWSRYAALQAADTIVRYMEHMGDINMKNLVIGPKELDEARNPDDDLESLLNLMRPLPRPKYYYAEATTDGDTTAIKPKIIVVGDSFWWTIAAQLPLKEVFSRASYWYYNSSVYYDDRYHSVNELNIKDELFSSDFVILFYCATQQYRMNDGFTQSALEALGVEDAIMDSTDFFERELLRNIGNILATPSLMESVREKAIKYNKTIEKAVRDDAQWIVNHKIQQGTLKWNGRKNDTVVLDSTAFVEREIQCVMKNLSADPKSREMIREKAEKYNKTFEKALRDDATWVVKRKIEKGTLKIENHGIQ